MPYKPNPNLLRDGYAPAMRLARELSKALTTIHRLAQDPRVKSARDGRALYIDTNSLEALFREDSNTALADIVKRVRAKLAQEAREG